MTWFTERRLDFIEDRLIRYGSIGRPDVSRHFDVSLQQASLDIAAYIKLNPHVRYDLSRRRYVAADDFAPVRSVRHDEQPLSAPHPQDQTELLREVREDAERLAREATEARFATRLATEDQRNGYEVGWHEGFLAALAKLDKAAALSEGEGLQR